MVRPDIGQEMEGRSGRRTGTWLAGAPSRIGARAGRPTVNGYVESFNGKDPRRALRMRSWRRTYLMADGSSQGEREQQCNPRAHR